jgi:hypothetical protein
MSDHKKIKLVYDSRAKFEAQHERNISAETASEILSDSAVIVEELLKHDQHMSSAPKNPELVAIHALMSLLDYEGERIANALEEIAESLDFMAARPDVNEASEVPTEREREIIYRALEGDFIRRGDGVVSGAELKAALIRFTKLAGL